MITKRGRKRRKLIGEVSVKLCRECGEYKVCRPRGLCWVCYYSPGVRETFVIESKFARKGVGVRNITGKTPNPTDARPGSPEKIAVLAARAEAGESLFHPDDSFEEQESRHARSDTQGWRVYRYWGWHHTDGGED